MKTPRLSPSEIKAIQEAFLECFPAGSELFLFGSRADSTKKGGDIDLYVETPLQNAEDVVKAKTLFLTKLVFKIGDQKVDVVIRFNHYDLPIHKIAKEEGIRLV